MAVIINQVDGGATDVPPSAVPAGWVRSGLRASAQSLAQALHGSEPPVVRGSGGTDRWVAGVWLTPVLATALAVFAVVNGPDATLADAGCRGDWDRPCR